MSRLQGPFYARDARQVGPDLLGRILITEIGGIRTGGRIVETEAYLGGEDPASHAFRGTTGRNRSMFLGGGHAYVYFIYGMYYCFNVVTGPEGGGQAVLIRAIEPLEGIETMLRRRGRESLRGLADGPGKLAIALGIGPELDGADLVGGSRVWIEEGEPVPSNKVLITPRIGITKAAELPWRWIAGKM